MNILLIHYAAPPVVGGVESVLYHHARLMSQSGHSVRILAGRGAQTLPEVAFVSLPEVDSRHPQVLALKAELDQGRVPPTFESFVSSLVDALRPHFTWAQVVIAHNVASLNKNLALTAALRRLITESGAPRLILWHHDLAFTTPRYRAELHEGYPWALLAQDWPGVEQVVVSELRRAELCELMNLPPERVKVIPNGLDLARFFKLEPLTWALVQRLDLLEAAPLLLLPVRLTPRKNIELALRALADLRQAMPAARLLVTGPLGPHNPANVAYWERLQALRAELGLQQAAIFLAEQEASYLPDEVIADCYRLADALLLPSLEEGFGIPVLEAGLSGLPLFCSDIPPLRALGGDQALYFSPQAEPAQVARLIAERLKGDPVYTLRVRVRTRYTWERIYHLQIAPLLEGRA